MSPWSRKKNNNSAQEYAQSTSLRLPFLRSYWVQEGSLLAGYYPGSSDVKEQERKLRVLLSCNVNAVINLVEDNEVVNPVNGQADYKAALLAIAAEKGLSISLYRFPIRDMSVPTENEMHTILDTIDAALASHCVVYVHCLGGLGRTGTVVGCWLARHRIAVGDVALLYLTTLRKNDPFNYIESPQTLEQCEFVRQWKEGR